MATAKSVLNEFHKDLDVYDIKEIIQHELKTPMSFDIIMLNLLLNGKFGNLNDTQKEILINIISSSGRSLLTLNNYLVYGNLIKPNFCEYNLEKLIKSVISDLNVIFWDRKQETFLDCRFKDCSLNIDKREIGRVFYNLIINLSESSDEGSKNLISIRKKGKFIEVFFINETYKSNFFHNKENKFGRISTDMSLAICEKIVNFHKGKLKINPFNNPLYAYKITFNIGQ